MSSIQKIKDIKFWNNGGADSSESLKNLRSFLQSMHFQDSIERLIFWLMKFAEKDTVKNEFRLFFKSLSEITTILLRALKEVKDCIEAEVLKKIPALSTRQDPLTNFIFSWVVVVFVQKMTQKVTLRCSLAQKSFLEYLAQACKKTVSLFEKAFVRIERLRKPVTLSEQTLKSFPNLYQEERNFLVGCIELLGDSFDLTTKQLERSDLSLYRLEAKSWYSWSGIRRYWAGGWNLFFKERKDGSVRIIGGTCDTHRNKFHENKSNILDIAKLLEGMSLDYKNKTSRAKVVRTPSYKEECKHDDLEYDGQEEYDELEEFSVCNNTLSKVDYAKIFGSQHSNFLQKKVSCLDECWV